MSYDHEELRRIVEEEKRDLARLDQSLAKSREKSREINMRMWKAHVGERLDEFLASRNGAEQFLTHSSWKFRWAALSILRSVWKPDESLAITCEHMAFEDPHPEVRAVAIFTLACCFEGTNDVRIGTLLAEIVRDATRPTTFRESAYQGLFALRGMYGRAVPLPGTYRIPNDVDWDFVNSFLPSAPVDGE